MMRSASGRGRRGFRGRVQCLDERPYSVPAAAPTADRNVDMLIGGQAVIEGVMMRSLTGYSVAVRQPDGGVAIKQDKLVSSPRGTRSSSSPSFAARSFSSSR